MNDDFASLSGTLDAVWRRPEALAGLREPGLRHDPPRQAPPVAVGLAK